MDGAFHSAVGPDPDILCDSNSHTVRDGRKGRLVAALPGFFGDEAPAGCALLGSMDAGFTSVHIVAGLKAARGYGVGPRLKTRSFRTEVVYQNLLRYRRR